MQALVWACSALLSLGGVAVAVSINEGWGIEA